MSPPGTNVSINGVVSGSNGLQKQGGGTLVLAANNTYGGNITTTLSCGTFVANGTLILGNGNGSGSYRQHQCGEQYQHRRAGDRDR